MERALVRSRSFVTFVPLSQCKNKYDQALFSIRKTNHKDYVLPLHSISCFSHALFYAARSQIRQQNLFGSFSLPLTEGDLYLTSGYFNQNFSLEKDP